MNVTRNGFGRKDSFRRPGTVTWSPTDSTVVLSLLVLPAKLCR